MTIKKNIGKKDRMARILLGIVAIAAGLYFYTQGASGLAGALIFVAAAMFITAALRFCGAYTLLGISTCCGSCQGDQTEGDVSAGPKGGA